MLLGLDVLPEYRSQGLARDWYAGISKENGEGEEKRLSLPAWNRGSDV